MAQRAINFSGGQVSAPNMAGVNQAIGQIGSLFQNEMNRRDRQEQNKLLADQREKENARADASLLLRQEAANRVTQDYNDNKLFQERAALQTGNTIDQLAADSALKEYDAGVAAGKTPEQLDAIMTKYTDTGSIGKEVAALGGKVWNYKDAEKQYMAQLPVTATLAQRTAARKEFEAQNKPKAVATNDKAIAAQAKVLENVYKANAKALQARVTGTSSTRKSGKGKTVSDVEGLVNDYKPGSWDAKSAKATFADVTTTGVLKDGTKIDSGMLYDAFEPLKDDTEWLGGLWTTRNVDDSKESIIAKIQLNEDSKKKYANKYGKLSPEQAKAALDQLDKEYAVNTNALYRSNTIPTRSTDAEKFAGWLGKVGQGSTTSAPAEKVTGGASTTGTNTGGKAPYVPVGEVPVYAPELPQSNVPLGTAIAPDAQILRDNSLNELATTYAGLLSKGDASAEDISQAKANLDAKVAEQQSQQKAGSIFKSTTKDSTTTAGLLRQAEDLPRAKVADREYGVKGATVTKADKADMRNADKVYDVIDNMDFNRGNAKEIRMQTELLSVAKKHKDTISNPNSTNKEIVEAKKWAREYDKAILKNKGLKVGGHMLEFGLLPAGVGAKVLSNSAKVNRAANATKVKRAAKATTASRVTKEQKKVENLAEVTKRRRTARANDEAILNRRKQATDSNALRKAEREVKTDKEILKKEARAFDKQVKTEEGINKALTNTEKKADVLKRELELEELTGAMDPKTAKVVVTELRRNLKELKDSPVAGSLNKKKIKKLEDKISEIVLMM